MYSILDIIFICIAHVYYDDNNQICHTVFTSFAKEASNSCDGESPCSWSAIIGWKQIRPSTDQQ